MAALPGLRHVGRAVRAEHERFVCDACHAMVSDRPYRAALTIDEARRQIIECSGTQLCPKAVGALLATLPARDAEYEAAA